MHRAVITWGFLAHRMPWWRDPVNLMVSSSLQNVTLIGESCRLRGARKRKFDRIWSFWAPIHTHLQRPARNLAWKSEPMVCCFVPNFIWIGASCIWLILEYSGTPISTPSPRRKDLAHDSEPVVCYSHWLMHRVASDGWKLPNVIVFSKSSFCAGTCTYSCTETTLNTDAQLQTFTHRPIQRHQNRFWSQTAQWRMASRFLDWMIKFMDAGP